MRKPAVILPGLAGLLLLIASSGCGTLVLPPSSGVPDAKDDPQAAALKRSADALALFSRGISESIAGNIEQARLYFEQASDLDPYHVDLHLDLAMSYLQQGQFEEMEDRLRRALALDPANLRAYQIRTLALRMNGRHEEALVPVTEAIRIAPTNVIHYLEAASIHTRLRNVPAAVQVLELGLDQSGDRLEILHTLGTIYVHQAREALSRGESPEVSPLAMMASGVNDYPRDASLLAAYGDLLVLHQKVEEALLVFERVEELNPDDPGLRQQLALSFAGLGDNARAIRMIEAVARQNPRRHRVWIFLGTLHEERGNQEEALAAYRQAIQARRSAAEGYIRMVHLLLQADQNEEALALLAEADTHVLDDIRIVELSAYLHLAYGSFSGALPYFARLQAWAETHDDVGRGDRHMLHHAWAQHMAGQHEQALPLLRQASEADPQALHDFMLMVFRQRHDRETLEAAYALVRDVESMLPSGHSSRILFGLIAFALEDHAVALEQFEEALALATAADETDDLSSEFFFWAGASSERLKRYEEAEVYFLRAIALQPDYAEAHNYLAYMHAERGVKLEMAYHHVGVALAIDPDNAAFIDTRGWVYFQRGEFEEALVDLARAADLMPDDPTIADHMGDVMAALHREDEAIVWWTRALVIDPENKDTGEKLRLRGVDPEAVLKAATDAVSGEE